MDLRKPIDALRTPLSERQFTGATARSALSAGLVTVNVVGGIVAFVLAAFVVPLPPMPQGVVDEVRINNLIVAAIVTGVGIILGVIGMNVQLDPMVKWIKDGADPADAQRISVLRAPGLLSLNQVTTWMAAAIGFGVFNAVKYDPELGVGVALIVLLAGISTAAFTYLATERAMRSFARKALEGAAELPPHRSVIRRQMAGWAWGSGVALLGFILVGIAVFIDQRNTTRIELAITMVGVGGIGLVVGALATFFSAKSTADPIRAMRTAMRQVENGDYEVSIPIYDATEIGHLQAGFNSMASGLQEREQMRDIFGRHVGVDVARNALEGGVKLGGEARDIAVLFVDIMGSTSIAEDEAPEAVVGLLNRFFTVVIDVVDSHQGWINKFEGDAALAIWGAPLPVSGQSTWVLRAGREMGRRLRDEVPEMRAGIGISTGRAVAGNVGAFQRYEYTVIGDPVNEAARLTDVAKKVDGLVVANARLLALAAPEEAEHWRVLKPVKVRGRKQETEIAAPRWD